MSILAHIVFLIASRNINI